MSYSDMNERQAEYLDKCWAATGAVGPCRNLDHLVKRVAELRDQAAAAALRAPAMASDEDAAGEDDDDVLSASELHDEATGYVRHVTDGEGVPLTTRALMVVAYVAGRCAKGAT